MTERWEIVELGKHIYIETYDRDDYSFVCDMQAQEADAAELPRIKRDAALIASAPELKADNDRLRASNAELREALRDIFWQTCFGDHANMRDTGYICISTRAPVMLRAAAALAKAEGGE